jgi:ribosomal protein S18 acetylase RimI-like enzyme
VAKVPISLDVWTAGTAAAQVPVIRDIYAAAFAEPPYLEGPHDVHEWLNDLAEQLTRPGFMLVLATVDGQPAGFAYGYTMTPDLPRWQRIVKPFAGAMPQEALRTGRVFTLMEFAVLREWRRLGIGRALHDRLLAERDEPLALLTVRADAAPAYAAYRAWGWRTIGHRPRDGKPGYDVLVREGQGRT